MITDDYQFLSSSTVANVADAASNQVLTGTGLGLLHAYDGLTGLDAAGFPKVTGGWLFAPAAISDDERMAAITREGYLFEWDVPGAPECQPEWPSFRHDPQGTGNYDADGTAPAAPGDITLAPLGGGALPAHVRVARRRRLLRYGHRYVADVDGSRIDLGPPVAGGETLTKDIELAPAGTRRADDPGASTRRENERRAGRARCAPGPGRVAARRRRWLLRRRRRAGWRLRPGAPARRRHSGQAQARG